MQGLTMELTLTQEQMQELARMVAAEMPKPSIDREAAMVARYGEACKIEQACEAMNVSRTTVYRMVIDGKIKTACDGKRIDVRSIARYMERD